MLVLLIPPNLSWVPSQTWEPLVICLTCPIVFSTDCYLFLSFQAQTPLQLSSSLSGSSTPLPETPNIYLPIPSYIFSSSAYLISVSQDRIPSPWLELNLSLLSLTLLLTAFFQICFNSPPLFHFHSLLCLQTRLLFFHLQSEFLKEWFTCAPSHFMHPMPQHCVVWLHNNHCEPFSKSTDDTQIIKSSGHFLRPIFPTHCSIQHWWQWPPSTAPQWQASPPTSHNTLALSPLFHPLPVLSRLLSISRASNITFENNSNSICMLSIFHWTSKPILYPSHLDNSKGPPCLLALIEKNLVFPLMPGLWQKPQNCTSSYSLSAPTSSSTLLPH